MQLRDYQEKAVNDVFNWLMTYQGNPCIEASTGAGKSWIIAGIVQKTIQLWPESKILILTHQKELVVQDCEKFSLLCPEFGVGVCSNGAGHKDFGYQVTFGSIGTVYKHVSDFADTDLIIIDEAHMINSTDKGMYRKFISAIENVKCIGLTATPYRLKSGMITDDGLFSEPLIKTVSIRWLQARGYLCRLVSKTGGDKRLSTDGVSIVQGDYAKNELEKAVDVPGLNKDVIDAVLQRAENRHTWLFFCSGVNHAQHIKNLLLEQGIMCECVTGNTPMKERDRILQEFKAGTIKAVTNANCLTTGFDAPNIDLIVMLRPTMSPGLLMQMLGRGLRVSPTKENCLVLDFTDNMLRLGTVHDIKPPQKKDKKKKGAPPCKICPFCEAIIPAQARTCPECKKELPLSPKEQRYQLSEVDLDSNAIEMRVKFWAWSTKQSKAGKDMIVVWYYNKNHEAVRQYLLTGYEGRRHEIMNILDYFGQHTGFNWRECNTDAEICSGFNKTKAPIGILHTRATYPVFLGYEWEET